MFSEISNWEFQWKQIIIPRGFWRSMARMTRVFSRTYQKVEIRIRGGKGDNQQFMWWKVVVNSCTWLSDQLYAFQFQGKLLCHCLQESIWFNLGNHYQDLFHGKWGFDAGTQKRDWVQRNLGNRFQLLWLHVGLCVRDKNHSCLETHVSPLIPVFHGDHQNTLNQRWEDQNQKASKPSIFNQLFSKISPYANADKNITNTKTSIENKMFILFDDTNNVKLFSNRGEYEIHFFDNRNNSIQLVDYKKCIVSLNAKIDSDLNEGVDQDLSEDEETEEIRVQQQLKMYGSERFHGTGSQD